MKNYFTFVEITEAMVRMNVSLRLVLLLQVLGADEKKHSKYITMHIFQVIFL